MKNFSQFTYRHIGSDSKNQDLMLKEIGCKSLNDLLPRFFIAKCCFASRLCCPFIIYPSYDQR